MESPTNRIEHKLTWLVVCVAVIGLVVLGWKVLGGDMTRRIPVSIGAKTFYAQVASTDSERKQGLSGTLSLDESQGLLMIFETDDTWKIWMKDMNYPIDIVWIDSNKHVVDTAQHAQPDSYPDKIYVPHAKSRYVLELPDGAISQYGIRNGRTINFNEAQG